MKIIDAWQYRWFIYFSLIIFALIAEIRGCPKVHAKDIYVDNVAEVYTVPESEAVIICFINSELWDITINWNLSNGINRAIDDARKRGVKIIPCKTHNVIVLDAHIVIMGIGRRVVVFDSAQLADEFLK